jgi:hypothetical protein
LNAGRNPALRAVTALLLVTVILQCNSSAIRLSVSGSRSAATLRHRSGEAPFLPQRARQKILTAQAYPRTNSAAAKDNGIPLFSSSNNAIDEMAALSTSLQNGVIHLMYLLRNSFPDRAPPHLT